MGKVLAWLKGLNYPCNFVFFVTARCNANCKMCFYTLKNSDELTLKEYEEISKHIKTMNILGISGGEPFIRDDMADIVRIFYKSCAPMVVELPTNGYFTESIIMQTRDILEHCKNMIVDLQLSIDGPEDVHNEIRGLKDSYARIRQTYHRLLRLKSEYKNLRLKACVVYSAYNQDSIEELFEILRRDFNDLDRVVFSVAHGTANPESFNFSWDRYFELCQKIKEKPILAGRDLHSIFTIALRYAKNDLLKDVLKNKDMYKHCGAGKRIIIVNETGEVFPCEQLWHSVGNLRANSYDLNGIINSEKMRMSCATIIREKCTCHWGLALSNAILYEPRYYPRILRNMAKIYAKRA